MCPLDPALQECGTFSYLHKICLHFFPEHSKSAHTIRLKSIELFPLVLTHSYLVLPRDRLHLYDTYYFLLNETLVFFEGLSISYIEWLSIGRVKEKEMGEIGDNKKQKSPI